MKRRQLALSERSGTIIGGFTCAALVPINATGLAFAKLGGGLDVRTRNLHLDRRVAQSGILQGRRTPPPRDGSHRCTKPSLAEFLDQRIRTANDLLKRLELRPLATIPYVSTQEERRHKRRNWIVLSVILLGLACAAVVAVHFLYSPLPMLFITVSRSLGLNF